MEIDGGLIEGLAIQAEHISNLILVGNNVKYVSWDPLPLKG